MSDNTQPSPLDRFITTKRPKQPSDTEKSEYQAAELFQHDEQAQWLRVYYSDGKWELLPYSLITNILSDSPGHLALIVPPNTIELQGENLRELFDDFQAGKIKTLTPFDADRHIQPETDTPVIATIQFIKGE